MGMVRPGRRTTAADKAKAATETGVEEFRWYGGTCGKDDVEDFRHDILRHMASSLGVDFEHTNAFNFFRGLILAVRDRLVDCWIRTQRSYYEQGAKRVYYLSLEYLPGRFLLQNLHNLGVYDMAKEAVARLGFDLGELAEMEWDPGLGNGGLGRLASCFLDSMATLNIPAYGYGIRYDYGIFYQLIENGRQVERCDNWMRFGNPWEFERPHHLYEVKFFGRVREYRDAVGRTCHEWIDTSNVMAMSCDMIVPGYRNGRAINMRLWAAKSSREFDLHFFNTGDYIGAVEERVRSENISKVLYPSDDIEAGRELRLRQQYFFVSATLQDIVRRFTKQTRNFRKLPDRVAIQLNETHPSIAIPELMRLLVDEERLDWDTAWDICTRTFAYTNHTVMPEALETWPVDMIARVLPRHLQIIYEINHRFLQDVERRVPGDAELLQRLSLIHEGPVRLVRMANLAIVGSSSVNGVSALHTEIIKARVFKDFYDLMPDRFNNKTNGITPRRWLLQCNQPLAGIITEAIGDGWAANLDELRRLEAFVDDAEFRAKWREARVTNKRQLAGYIRRETGQGVRVASLFDVHVKRIHEYKRQMLNILHVVTLYSRLKDAEEESVTPRTVIFAGKAAPAYFVAKMIIALINAVAKTVNNDPRSSEMLRVVFLPNYCISQAEKVVPATDLSEQISTAGLEASGTGNMKFALNGALTIGTLDGANIEMQEEIGAENMFIFGHTAEQLSSLRINGYDPRAYYEADNELKRALDMIAGTTFSPHEPGVFRPLVDLLLSGTYPDPFYILADYRAYIDRQDEVGLLYRDHEQWTRRSILNTARMGKFSSDRAIREYADEIWHIRALP